MSGIIVGSPTSLAAISSFTTLSASSTPAAINAGSTDGADNRTVAIQGGGAAGATRGGSITCYGNEAASAGGSVILDAGDNSLAHVFLNLNNGSSQIKMQNGSGRCWFMDNNGLFQQDSSNGGRLTFNRANTTINFAGTMGDSTKAPQTVAPDDWIEVQVAGVTRYIPVYAIS